MRVRIEFLGLARRRAGQADIELVLEGTTASLAAVLHELAQRLPGLGRELWTGGELAAHWAVCLDGARFVRDPAALVPDGTCVWLLSADAGG
jgi:molybdopterin converting factor small subunit